ncbi:MAG: HpcH/HpaI aldolase family protein [Acetivibrionales bacterium]|jgi:2-keto-3-deoxy-L-rhamnonate aldolase RhmA
MYCKMGKFVDKIANGKTVFGTHTFWGGATTTEIYGEVGYDAVWIDTEHGAIDKAQLMNTIIGASASDMVTFVRVAWNDMVLAKPILEMGVDGVIFPMVLNAEEARKAVSACRYPPEGVRGFGPCRAIRYGNMDVQEYIHKYSKKIWVVVQIEHIKAVENLDEILKVEGLDAIIVGPCDLSGSMGLLAETKHPEVKRVMDEIAAKAKASGKPFGVSMGYDEEAVREWISRGANMIFCDTDASYIYNGSKATLERLNNAVAYYQGK